MKKLIKNGTIVLEDKVIQGDLLIEDEVIAEIGQNLDAEGGQIIDATGLVVLPGGIDVHTHFNIDVGVRAVDDFSTGTIAAAFGGTTTIVTSISGFISTISASLPGARTPFFGYIPKILAGFVLVTAANSFKLNRPFDTPSEKTIGIRVSTPGAPFGHFVKSFLPFCLSPWKSKLQWSVAITCNVPSLIPCQIAS